MENKTFYSISEVSKLLDDEPESKIRYYVNHFKLNVPIRAGKLAFSQKNVEKLRKILELRNEQKFTLAGAKASLKKEVETKGFEEEVSNRLKNIERILLILKEHI